jgi:hypothetical protein
VPELAVDEEVKVFGGIKHRRINTIELQPGDYILFYKEGVRARRVREVIIGRKRRLVKFDPIQTPVFKAQTCQLDEVISAWRAREGT